MISGIVFGLAYAILFYAFCAAILYCLLYFSAYFLDYVIALDSIQNQSYTSLFLGFLSAIIGQTICFSIWFNRPMLKHLKNKRHRIMNDQTGLVWVFLHWFLKIVMVFSFIVGFLVMDVFFQSTFFTLLSLVLVVLYFQSLAVLRQILKHFFWRFGLISFLAILCIGFSLSKWTVLDSKPLRTAVMNNNPIYKYGIQLPSVYHGSAIQKRSHVKTLYITYDEDKTTSLHTKNKTIELDQIGGWCDSFKASKGFQSDPFLLTQLVVDGKVPMKDFNTVRKELAKHRSHSFFLSFDERQIQKSLWVKEYHGIYTWFNPEMLGINYKSLAAKTHFIDIKHTKHKDSVLVNLAAIHVGDLKNHLVHSWGRNYEKVVRYKVELDLPYKEYIRVVSNLQQSLRSFKDRYSILKHNLPHQYLPFEDAEPIDYYFKLRIFEITADTGENYDTL